MDDMNELVLDFLQDIYYAEKASIRAMGKMTRAAEADALQCLLTEHRKLSETQVSRLDDVFGTLGKRPKGKQCAAMDGLIHEAEECIEESDKGPVLDAALIACAQAMEHYEIARYGALAAWTRTMGNAEGAEILQAILAEEKEADARYNELALKDANPAANEEKPDDEEPEPEPEPAKAKAPRKPKAASTSRASKAGKPAPEPEVPEPEVPEPEAAEPDAPEADTAPAPAAKRKSPARKKAASPEPEAAAPAPAAKPKRGRPRTKA